MISSDVSSTIQNVRKIHMDQTLKKLVGSDDSYPKKTLTRQRQPVTNRSRSSAKMDSPSSSMEMSEKRRTNKSKPKIYSQNPASIDPNQRQSNDRRNTRQSVLYSYQGNTCTGYPPRRPPSVPVSELKSRQDDDIPLAKRKNELSRRHVSVPNAFIHHREPNRRIKEASKTVRSLPLDLEESETNSEHRKQKEYNLRSGSAATLPSETSNVKEKSPISRPHSDYITHKHSARSSNAGDKGRTPSYVGLTSAESFNATTTIPLSYSPPGTPSTFSSRSSSHLSTFSSSSVASGSTNISSNSTRSSRTMSITTHRTSLTLINQESALSMYRENAKKTNNSAVQLEFAKYLVACASVLGEPCSTSSNSSSHSASQTLDSLDSGKSGNKNSKDLLEEANFWIRRLQKNGDPEATYIMGTWIENGLNGFSPNPNKAFGLYNRSSKLGYVKAMHKVACHHEIRKEYSKAQQFYLKAATQGNSSANYRLAKAYMHGELRLKPNINQGILYLARAVNSNDRFECPEASYIYGLILADDYGHVDISSVPKDIGMSQDLIERSAELGYTPALYKLGYAYEFGELGYKVDPAKSIFYYKQGAERGDPECQMGLSGWYLSGVPEVLEPNDDLAYSWCNQAASKGLPKAEFAMGYYYELGIGVPKDLSMANLWYVRAASHGSTDAQRRLERGDETGELHNHPHHFTGGAQGLKKEFNSIKHQKKQNKEDCIIS
ncbi:hypothetical protein K7432_000733 [Basidiobolus ranarum]|uniref:HCP-like protein n=1 Tax=Basidiobolus ranarum TaxID=34480 RepID=A0ABR2WAS3_9FUNG